MTPVLYAPLARVDTHVFVGNVHECGGNVVDIDPVTGIGFCDGCDVECATRPVQELVFNPVPT